MIHIHLGNKGIKEGIFSPNQNSSSLQLILRIKYNGFQYPLILFQQCSSNITCDGKTLWDAYTNEFLPSCYYHKRSNDLLVLMITNIVWSIFTNISE